ncbi:MAG TPA: hypothetical protein VEV15_01185 [Flavisolibacter sp.]|nr:hypothetical protein [Flavisolibacter sp.]
MKKIFSLFILLITLSGTLFSQRSSVSATVNKEKILIGEQVQLYLKAVLPKGGLLPWFVVDTFPHFEILQQSKIDSQLTSEGLFLQQTITLTSWDSGRWFIPAFSFANTKTKPVMVTVGYTQMAPDQPYNDIKDIIEVEKPFASNWYWYLIGIAVLVALFLLFFPPKQEKSIAATPVPAEDAYKAALKRLGKLNAGDDPKYLYTELVDVFRDYLQKRKNIQSFSKTTDDLSVQIKELQLPVEQYHQLVQVLRLSDMVKFAKYQPQLRENEEAMSVIEKNIITIENLQ